ncbi:MAG TPA: 50S ribosomal protein L6 [Candidatus Pacebacteria bacterium]|nr:50S ribosomal protein L6 [Candidatus Paceibacterota bacterium]
MSKIGKKPISIPTGVTITVNPGEVTVKGIKGELKVPVANGAIKVAVQDGIVSITRQNDERETKAFHGLVRSLLANAVAGVTVGYKKTLKLVGTGYRATSKGAGISIAIGFSHPVEVAALAGVTLKVEGNDTIQIESISKELVGQVAANIRSIRPPEPYLGKGIRYSDEVVRRKAGKTAAG